MATRLGTYHLCGHHSSAEFGRYDSPVGLGISALAGVFSSDAQRMPLVRLPISTSHGPRLENAVRTRGVQLSVHRIVRAEEVINAIDEARASGVEALGVLASPLLNAQRRLIIERAAVIRLPAIYQWPETVKEGGLAAYGPSFAQTGRQNAQQLAKILGGIKPADLPVQQPTKFDLAINLKTAKALRLTIPQSLLSRADEVIE